MKDYQYLQQKYLINLYPNRGLNIVSGKGFFLYDEKGDKYLDMMSNYGVNIFGYNQPFITKSIIAQWKKLPTLHCSFTNDIRALAAEKLIEKCGNGLEQVYFSNSGAEAIEAALKFAVLATGKKKFIAFRDGYHGKTLGALSATDGIKYREPFEPLLWNFKHINYNDIPSLEKVIGNDIAALVVEPIQGEGGIIVPDTGYLKKIRELCDKYGILLIIDEVQTGVGRTGFFLASESEDISYDIVCLGKGLAGGIPIGATLVSNEISLKIPKTVHGSTFGGNPLASAGILATLELLDENMLNQIKNLGKYFIDQLKLINSNLVKRIHGSGLMIGVEVYIQRNEILKKLQQNKILAIPAGENVIRFLPPYIINKKQINFVVNRFTNILVS